MGAFLEELGWTGFAVPTLRLRHVVLAIGLIVGAVVVSENALSYLPFACRLRSTVRKSHVV
jgi:hypothetical protein